MNFFIEKRFLFGGKIKIEKTGEYNSEWEAEKVQFGPRDRGVRQERKEKKGISATRPKSESGGARCPHKAPDRTCRKHRTDRGIRRFGHQAYR